MCKCINLHLKIVPNPFGVYPCLSNGLKNYSAQPFKEINKPFLGKLNYLIVTYFLRFRVGMSQKLVSLWNGIC